MRKFHPLDDVTIIKTWSNCGLIERRNCEIENLEDYVIYTQQELVELKNALGNMVAKQYFEKIKIYVDVYNKLTTYIYNYPLVIENTSVDTVLHLWNNVFNTTEINGKIEVLKLN